MNASSVELVFCMFSVPLSPVGCKTLPYNVFTYPQIENNTQYFTVTTNTVFKNVQSTVNHSKQDENGMK